MYQSDLCAAMIDELEERFSPSQLDLRFDAPVEDCDVFSKTVRLESTTGRSVELGPFDLVVGCDGVNSPVRTSLEAVSDRFESVRTDLPGIFKVVRLQETPEKLDPTTVALMLPKSGSIGAFIEPTARGSCILFNARNATDTDVVIAPSQNDISATATALEERFPLLAGADFDDMARQLANQRGGRAATVDCNTYHFGSSVALCGDAAHATGGITGQGVNSALIDAQVLVDSLEAVYDPNAKEDTLASALLAYSQQQVPEGKALYDLSLGPKPKGAFKRVRLLFGTAIDSLFRGRLGIGNKPLQTELTTTMTPFSEIRKRKDKYFDKPFGDPTEPLAAIAEQDMMEMQAKTGSTILKR